MLLACAQPGNVSDSMRINYPMVIAGMHDLTGFRAGHAPLLRTERFGVEIDSLAAPSSETVVLPYESPLELLLT